MDSKYVKCLEKLRAANQEHLLAYWDELDANERAELLGQLEKFDFEQLDRMLHAAKLPTVGMAANMVMPLGHDDLVDRKEFSDRDLAQYRRITYTAMRQGKVAVIIMAGGMGTRLGSNLPKGMYDLGLNTTRTLFELQAKRLLKLQTLAEVDTAFEDRYKSTPIKPVPLYVMTSAATDSETRYHFMANNYFGLKRENVVFFQQNQLPCYDLNNRIIMRTRSQLAQSPDGNGGIYQALLTAGILEDMRSRGVRYLHVYCVDNILIRVADPVFMGVAISRGADAAVKVIEKLDWAEPVGIVCKRKTTTTSASKSNSCYRVLEYSEMTDAMKQERQQFDPHLNNDLDLASKPRPQPLAYNAANIANHFFSIDFLNEFADHNCDRKLPVHLARKKIESLNGEKVAGVKLEKFVFDSLPFAKQFFAFRVQRDEEFSPLKNGLDSSTDNVRTCRNDLYRLHRRFVEKAGGSFANNSDCSTSAGGAGGDGGARGAGGTGDENVCEIDPALTYEGENLSGLVAGSVFQFPLVLSSSVSSPATSPSS